MMRAHSFASSPYDEFAFFENEEITLSPPVNRRGFNRRCASSHRINRGVQTHARQASGYSFFAEFNEFLIVMANWLRWQEIFSSQAIPSLVSG